MSRIVLALWARYLRWRGYPDATVRDLVYAAAFDGPGDEFAARQRANAAMSRRTS